MLHIHAILADSPLFSGLQRPNIERIAQSVALRHLKKKAILFHEGTEGTTVYVLLKGAIQIHKTDEDGSERVIRIFKPGEMFAQVILFERPDYPVTASALERSEVLGIPRRSLLALLEDAAFRNDFIAGLMQRQRYLANRIATLSTTDAQACHADIPLFALHDLERVQGDARTAGADGVTDTDATTVDIEA